jgi:alcohol dehydrogenase, propanol-preferring
VNGSFAEYAIGAAAYVARLPERTDFAALAPILCAGVTTYKGLKDTEARPGEWVAISGLGGLGHIAVQYAKAMGLHVVALDVTDDKLVLARDLGAKVTVNAKSPDAVAQVLKATGGGAHGVLVTAVSPVAFAQALRLARHRGTVSLVGLPPGEFATPIFDCCAEAHYNSRLDRRYARRPCRSDCIRGRWQGARAYSPGGT